MPTLYDASKKLRKLPDSTYGTSRKLASISLSKMATSDSVAEQTSPEGIVITADDLERKVKIFRIKIKNIGNYLLQIPSASKKEGSIARNLEGEFEGTEGAGRRRKGGRRRRLKGGADDEEPQQTAEDYLRELEEMDQDRKRQIEDIIQRLQNRATELEEGGSEDEEDIQEEADDLQSLADEIGGEIGQQIRDALDNGDIGTARKLADKIGEDLENQYQQYGLTQKQGEELGVSQRLINFNSLFGKATQAVDDAQIFFNESIAPYKKSLTAVQIENINNDLDSINELFKRVTQSPALLALNSRGQTHEPYDQLQSAFKDFRVSVRGVINSAVVNVPRNDEGQVGASTLSGGSLSHRHTHHKHFRQEAPSLSIMSKHKRCSQKFLL